MEKVGYFVKYYPNDFYVLKYGMSYRNFVRTLPITDNDCYTNKFKTLSICLISKSHILEDYVNYLRVIGTEIYRNMNDSNTAFSIRKFIEEKINFFLDNLNIDRNKPNMFYEDSFLLISHECQDMQNRQVSHLVGKIVNGEAINKLSDIVCFPHSYFESFEKTIEETKSPEDALSIKLDYIVNTLDGLISPDDFTELVDLILKMSERMNASMKLDPKSKGLDLYLYVKHHMNNFLNKRSVSLGEISSFFYDECFLTTIYKIQEERLQYNINQKD